MLQTVGVVLWIGFKVLGQTLLALLLVVGLMAINHKLSIRRRVDFYKRQGIPFHYQSYNMMGCTGFGMKQTVDPETEKNGVIPIGQRVGLNRVAKDELGKDWWNAADMPLVGK